MKISLGLILLVAVAYVAGAKWPGLAKRIPGV